MFLFDRTWSLTSIKAGVQGEAEPSHLSGAYASYLVLYNLFSKLFLTISPRLNFRYWCFDGV